MQQRFIIDEKSSIILEGGGMRGVFTCGVLDSLMERGITFPLTVGVSAGACNGLSYMSHQRGRARYCNIDLLKEYNYIGFKYLIAKGSIMDFDLLFKEIPERISPYDYEALAENPDEFVMVTTNCLTGKAEYLSEKHNSKRIMDIVRASSSLPYVTRIAYVDGTPMLDGGIADSIPIAYARSRGFKNSLVVLTRNRGYRKSEKSTPLSKLFYKKYPKLQSAIKERNRIYNNTLDYIERLEERGEILVIRPERPIEVGRMEKECSKLEALYDEGYRIASEIEFEMKR